MKTDMTTKPPAQTLGVTGIESLRVTDTTIDYSKLVTLPPFQMFMVEQRLVSPEFAGQPSYYQQSFTATRMEELYHEYARWHAEKGYWPNETPMGVPEGVSGTAASTESQPAEVSSALPAPSLSGIGADA